MLIFPRRDQHLRVQPASDVVSCRVLSALGWSVPTGDPRKFAKILLSGSIAPKRDGSGNLFTLSTFSAVDSNPRPMARKQSIEYAEPPPTSSSGGSSGSLLDQPLLPTLTAGITLLLNPSFISTPPSFFLLKRNKTTEDNACLVRGGVYI